MGNDVAAPQLAENLLDIVARSADVDHDGLTQVIRGLDSPVKRHKIVLPDNALGQPDLYTDDHVRVKLRRVNCLVHTRPADVFQFADLVIELAHT